MSIRFVEGSLSQLASHLKGLRWVPISDSNVARLLPTDWPAPIVVPAGESSKSLETTRELYAQLAERGVDRQTRLVAVGGGVVGDLVGFVAATYLRGVPLVQVPTSLVAMVDSSLGGKVGVDLPAGKNLVGAFYLPELHFLDTSLLDSLPPREWNAGMAEVLKHALLDGPDHWQRLESLAYPLAPEQRRQLVLESRRVKQHIVDQDPREEGIRAFLNLGHTLAHAIESAQGYQGWNHGEAVGFGLRAALRLSQRRLDLDPLWEERLCHQLRRYALPEQRPPLALDTLLPYLARDKKNRDGQLRFVLLREPGRAEVVSGIEPAELQELWEELP